MNNPQKQFLAFIIEHLIEAPITLRWHSIRDRFGMSLHDQPFLVEAQTPGKYSLKYGNDAAGSSEGVFFTFSPLSG